VPYAEAARPSATLLADFDRSALEDVCRRHNIVWLAVFGSLARGDARADSDVDVVVDFAPGMTPGFGIVRVADALRPVLGGRRLDLVTRSGLSPRLREQILSSAQTLYAAE
jgi:predicted nucleotidyltransferase